jgi:hypothetical protein
MKDVEYYKSKYSHIPDEKIEELYTMIDTIAYLLVEECDFDIQNQ